MDLPVVCVVGFVLVATVSEGVGAFVIVPSVFSIEISSI